MTIVAYSVWKILHDSSSIREQSGSDVAVQRRLLFFVFLLLGILLVLFSWRFDLQRRGQEMIEIDLSYIICRMKNDLGLQYDDSCTMINYRKDSA